MIYNEKKNLFLSYRRADNKNYQVTKFQEELVKKLNRTLSIYFDMKHMENGPFDENLRSAVENCDCFLPIVSKEYISFRKSNDWCKKELKLAISNKKLIVPTFICNPDEICKEYGFDSTKRRARTDFENINKWSDKELIEYLTIYNGAISIVEENNLKKYALIDSTGNVKEELIQNTLKNIYNSFCDSKNISFFFNWLKSQKDTLKQTSIQSTNYSFDMDEYIDFGITGKPTKAEYEIAKEQINLNPQKSINDFLPNLSNFSLKKFVEKFESERYAIVTGDAGQGKSIFLKQVCRFLCDKAEVNGLSRSKLFPIYAEIKRIALKINDDENYSFFDSLAKASVIEITKEQIESIIECNGKLCLILDAMDEVSPDTFDKLHDEILKANIVDKCCILISSRPGQKRIKDSSSMGLSVELFNKTFRIWTVNNISDEKFDVFIEKETSKNQYDKINKEFIKEFSQELKNKESSDEKYKYMSRNPFMLKTLVSTYFNRKTLPKNKIEAFDCAVNIMIEREKKGITHTFSFNANIKKVLGYIAYMSYQSKDKGENIYIDKDRTNNAIEKNIRNENAREEIYAFLEQHKLVDENGFSHDLFSCYYCAFYLYKTLANKEDIGKFLKDINPNTDYWKEVVETLICLFELNANNDETKNLLETMLISMQTVVKNPDYDILCSAVSQFIDHKYNKLMGESILINSMLERGERGIKAFDINTYECSEGENPYEELFYYVVKYNFVLGLDKLYRDNKDNNKLSPIQTYLFNELYKMVKKEDKLLAESDTSEYREKIEFASSKDRKRERKNLKGHVKIQNGIDIIDSEFHDCSSLTSITIPNSVTSIGNSVFVDCSSLTTITIPNSVTSIGDYVFYGCGSLTTITIPNSVTSIGNFVFYGCSSLTTITIPNSVTSMGWNVFCGCCSLTIYCEANSQLSGWDLSWNLDNRPVYWGVNLK